MKFFVKSTRFFSIVMFILLCTGCALQQPMPSKFTQEDFSPVMDSILPEYDLAFNTLRGKSVYWDVRYAPNGSFFVEDVNLPEGTVLKTSFSPSDSFERYLFRLSRNNEMLTSYDEKSADYSVHISIERLQAVVENINADWQPAGLDVSNNALLEWAIMLEGAVDINGQQRKFRRIIKFRKDIALRHEALYLVLAGAHTTTVTTQTVAEYLNKTPIANVAHTKTITGQVALLFINEDQDIAGEISIYSPTTYTLEKRLSITSEDIAPTSELGYFAHHGVYYNKIAVPSKRLAFQVYTMPRGYFTILSRELAQFAFEEMVRSS